MINKISDFVQDALYRKSAGQHAYEAIIWGSANAALLTIILYDLETKGYSHWNSTVWWCAVVLCIICSLNIIVHLKCYLSLICSLTPLEINAKQRKLLSVNDSDIGFKSLSQASISGSPVRNEQSPKLSELYEATIRTPPPQSIYSTSLSSPNKSWFGSPNSPQQLYTSFASSTGSLSPVLNMSQGGDARTSPSVTADSWSFYRNQSLNSSFNGQQSPSQNVFSTYGSHSPNNSSVISSSPMNYSSFTSSERQSINTKDDLNNYLKQYHEREKKRHILSQNENGNGGNNSLWAYSSTNTREALNLLSKNIYQYATKDAGQETSSSSDKNEDYKTAILSSNSVSKIWLKRNVNPKQIFQYEENLRIWLSMNVLQPLVHLIDLSNEAIAATAPELQIGNVGVDKLKKAAQNISGVKQLSNLLPFLDLTLHQDYLVQRLRDLSKGGAISAYQWNAGGNYNGRLWREEYPTDTYILLHLFAMYMDNHLPPDPTQPDGRVFSNVYIVKTPEKPPKPAIHPCLYLTQMNPPHLKVILPGEEECDVGAGHKNFIHSLLLFCHHLTHQQHSHIAGVNLNLSGINLAWVLNAD